MGVPSRFPFGISTTGKVDPLAMFGLPDPTDWVYYFNDFNTYASGDWTITAVEAGASSSSVALTDVHGGAILITNDAADNDSTFLNKKGEFILPAAGKPLMFGARFKVSDATESDWVMGLQVTDTTPLAAGGDGATDGIFFQKDDGDTQLDFYVMKNTTTGQSTTTNFATAAASDTFMELHFFFDGVRYVTLWKDQVQVATVDLAPAGAALTDDLPDTELTISFGIQNGEAVSKTMTVDWIFAAQAR